MLLLSIGNTTPANEVMTVKSEGLDTYRNNRDFITTETLLDGRFSRTCVVTGFLYFTFNVRIS